MKKILFLMNTLSGGGAEKVLVDMANNLDCTKYDITLQTIFDIGIYKSQLNSNIKYKSIFNIKHRMQIKLYDFFLYKLNMKNFYKKYIDDNYDIEVAFLEGIPTKILAKSNNPNKFAWVHIDLYNYYGQTKMFRSVQENAECYKKFKKIFCVSQSAKEGFKKRFGFDDNVGVLYNPIDEKNIRQKANEPVTEVVENNKFKIISVGRLVHQKGYDRLLRVHKRLLDEGFDYELWILGEGDERRNLEQYIWENNLDSSVKLLGFQKNPYKFMARSDLFVCSSWAEGFSTVVSEATILGIPIVTTNCSGMRELLGESEFGLIVDNDENELYYGVKSLLVNKDLLKKYGDKSRIRGEQFSIKEAIKKIEESLEC